MGYTANRPIGQQLTLFGRTIETWNDSLPPKTRSSNDPKGRFPKYRYKHEALEHLHVGPNGNYVSSLCFDIDRDDDDARGPARYAYDMTGLPEPTFVMTNRETKNCHYIYHLEVGVPQFEVTESKALRYLHAIQHAYTERLDADWSYPMVTVKNPNRTDHWDVELLNPYPFDLGFLAEHLSRDELRRPRAELLDSRASLGRNCRLFEEMRLDSYKQYRRLGYPELQDFAPVMLKRVGARNELFETPLPTREVRSIANSISKFCVKRFSAEEFSAIQSTRGQRKGRAKRDEFLGQVLQLSAQGLGNREIARRLGISHQTIGNWLKRSN